MARLIVRYRGQGSRPESVIRQIRQMPNVSIVDDSDRMLLVDGPEAPLRDLLQPFDDWLIAAEKKYPIPGNRKRIERPPSS